MRRRWRPSEVPVWAVTGLGIRRGAAALSGGPGGGWDGDGEPMGGREAMDFRLVIPAVTTWLTALVLIGCQPMVAYVTAGICGCAVVPALATVRPGRLSGKAGVIARHGALAGAALVCAAASAAGVGMRLSAT